MTLKAIDSLVNGMESDGYSFSLVPHRTPSPTDASTAVEPFHALCLALKERIADVLRRMRATLTVESIQVGKCLVSTAPAKLLPFDADAPATWDHAKSVRNAYMAARSNESKADALDCDFLLGLHAVVPADVPDALRPFAVDHQRLAMLYEIALSESLAADAALLERTRVQPPIAVWDEVHKSADGTLIFILVKVSKKKN